MEKQLRRQDARIYRPRFEALESRQLLAVTAVFAPTTGVLNVFGDSGDNTIEVSRNAGGAILVNGGAVAIAGGAPTIANTSNINVFGLSGNDTITLNEANGALPAAKLYGGSGNDTIIGGSAADYVFGQSGGDNLQGRGGMDFLFGGSGDDQIVGGDGDDLVYGQNGNDKMVWNPGDDTDLNEGGAGIDRVEVNGGNGAEVFTTTSNGTRVRFDRLDPAPFSIDIGTSEFLFVNMNGGSDQFSATGNLAALMAITVDGGAGDDTILGSNGNDTLLGGDGNDFIDGQQGNDIVNLGAGDDTFQWDPGDGNDTIQGNDGIDTLIFQGSNAAEDIELSANFSGLQLKRNVADITLTATGIEKVQVNLLGGADTFIVNAAPNSEVTEVLVNLAGLNGQGDGAVDNVIVNGTQGEDIVFIQQLAGLIQVSGLAATVKIAGWESANDRLTVNLLGGDDVLDATGLTASGIQLTADGGDDDDVLLGGDGNDTLLGGNGDDVLIGGSGLDILDGGPGDNVVIQ